MSYTELREEIAEIDQSVDLLDERVAELEEDIDLLQARIEHLGPDLQQLRAEIARHLGKIASLSIPAILAIQRWAVAAVTAISTDGGGS